MVEGKNSTVNEPKLDKPGAGLPLIEWALAKYWLLPKALKTKPEVAIKNFESESRKIKQIYDKYDDAQLSEKKLIKRLRGLEDSSRYWSIAMTLEHLTTVNQLMLVAITELSNGNNKLPSKGTAEVKPEGSITPREAIDAYEKCRDNFIAVAATAEVDAHPKLTTPHPWFGQLNAREWLIFPSIHSNIHRQQIKLIAEQLDAATAAKVG